MELIFRGLKVQYRKLILLALIALFSITAQAQNGTYRKKDANGGYCIISLQKLGNQVKAEIFSWWNTPSAQTGSYSGEGEIQNSTVLLHSNDNGPDCKVVLSIGKDQIKASFADCDPDHLPIDFNGLYRKFTDAVAGDYIVIVPKAFFYKTTDLASKQKSYVIKGDKVLLDIDRINTSKKNWVEVYFTNKAGKDIAGYMLLDELKRINY